MATDSNIQTRNGAVEFVQKAIHNITTLHSHLSSVGYRFARPEGPYQFAGINRNKEAIYQAETRFDGSLPFLFRKWYEVFDWVDFSQDEKQLHTNDGSAVAGLGYNITLVYYDLISSIRMYEELARKQPQSVHDDANRKLLPSGTFASNCTPKGVWLPDKSIDPVLYNDGAGPITFSKELRSTFAGGGFPFWEKMCAKRRISSPLGYVPLFHELKPILTNGLLPL